MKKEIENTKRVILVTWKGRGNYGSCLQAFALNKMIESLGYQVQFLSAGYHQFCFKTYIKQLLYSLGILKLLYKVRTMSMDIKRKKTTKFQNKTINEIELFSERQLRRIVSQTDCFVTGSDQIWNTYYSYYPFNFLSFAGNVKRVAYASSIGTNSIKEEYADEVKDLLLKFSHIGVREKEAVQVLTNLTKRKDIRSVLDPTFLLTLDEWNKVAEKAIYEETLPEEYILCYFVGNNIIYNKYLEDVLKTFKLNQLIVIPYTGCPVSCSGKIYEYRKAGPAEFVDLIKRAKYVCTDSFHATALSINFSVPFVEFMRFKDNDPKSQNSRIYDVLNHYGLMNCIYKPNSKEWQKPIDYGKVQEILQMDRKDSEEFLINSIEN